MEQQTYAPTVIRFLRSGREYFYHVNGRGYVDLDDLRDLKADGEPFLVRDEETGKDITAVLLA